MKIHHAGIPSDGCGWGICNRYLIRELGKLAELTDAASADVVFMPLADHDLNPLSDARAKINLAYTFFEFPLGPNAAANATKYDTVFTGSTWCKNRLAEIGVQNTEVLIQGVDFDIFKPDPILSAARKDKEFRIFSGGKFEYRKGQDLVLAAFKLLHEKYPEMRLVTAWHNPWPQLINTMRQSMFIKMPDFDLTSVSWEKALGMILTENEIPKEKVFMVASSHGNAVPQDGMAHVMNQTDVGVFPNRCEGGTNLVMMEYMACSKPVVANMGTGHGDVINGSNAILIGADSKDAWCYSTPEQVADSVDASKKATEIARGLGASVEKPFPFGVPDIHILTWTRAAKQIIDHIETINARGIA